METGLNGGGDGPAIIHLRVIIILQLIISYAIVILCHIFADVDIVVILFGAVRFLIFLPLRLLFCEFIRHILGFIMTLLTLLQSRILLQFLLDPFFQVGRGHLQQLHHLDLLGRKPL